MHIDEIELLIGDIEFDNMYNEIQKESRKLKWNKNKLQKKFIRKIIIKALFYILILNTLFKMKYPNCDNYYSKEQLVASNDEIKKGLEDVKKKLNIKIDNIQASDYLILKSILDNKNLNEQEKDIALELFPILEDNVYYNKEYTYQSLENVDIKWCERSKFVEDNCLGMYVRYFDFVKGYEGVIKDYLTKEEDKNSNYSVLRHELIHALFSFDNNLLPHSFGEGMTELLDNEYYEKEPFMELESYPFEILYVKMLCELVGENHVLEAYTTGNMDVIYNNMALLQGSSEEAKKLLKEIDSFLTKKSEDNLDVDVKKYNDLFSKLDSYISLKNENNDYYYYYRFLMDSIKDTNSYDSYVSKCISTADLELANKAYFSTKLKEENKNKVYTKI